MCGINGLFAYNNSAPPPLRAELIATRDHMSARGPDGVGEWWSRDQRLGLGHRRLSIIDLSERANQPMLSADGALVVVFNGEIYNYPELRRELEASGTQFRTTSDTEVLLQLYAQEGEAMVARLRGMFALAIWDNTRRGLFLARDPYGIKPLYTANDGWTFRFASQVKALLAGGGVSRNPEPAGIVGFHLWGCVPEPFTLYRDVRSLPAGYTQWIDRAGPRAPKSFASIPAVLESGGRAPARVAELDQVVRDATLDSVRAHLLSDVEVGLFLSAGIDSGALLGLMRDAGQQKIRAVTLVFDEFRGTTEDEAPLAADLARRYNAEHVIRRVDKREFNDDLPAIFEAMDQPSIDGINTWFVAKAASESGLKVALSGVGGDELLGGYASFRQIPRLVGILRLIAPFPSVGKAVRMLGCRLGLFRSRPKTLGILEYGTTFEGAYLLRRALLLPFELKTVLDPDVVREGLRRLNTLRYLRQIALRPCPTNPLARVAALESTIYLRNQLLRDADWAGMAHSLEIRTPLVDFQLLRRIAPVMGWIDGGDGKRALASAPSRPLPSAVTNKNKTGFSVPTAQWNASNKGANMDTRGEFSRKWALQVTSEVFEKQPPSGAPFG